jgi:predicted nucleic acid-binding protein
MTAPVFVDTNVLVYAIDLAAGDRHIAARRWMEALWPRQAGRLSAQTLGCGTLLIEELQDGQDFDGLVVVSPFRVTPSKILGRR